MMGALREVQATPNSVDDHPAGWEHTMLPVDRNRETIAGSHSRRGYLPASSTPIKLLLSSHRSWTSSASISAYRNAIVSAVANGTWPRQ